jgi:uncharacterized protein (DUF2147 family)
MGKYSSRIPQTSSFIAVILFLATALFADDDITGFWKATDGSSPLPRCIVGIYEYDGEYYGRMIATYGKKGGIKDTIYNQVEHAPGIVGNPPYCGMDFIYGLEDNDTYFKGNIVDPQQGKVYVSEVWAENGTLKVRGKLWVFGKTMTWYPAEASDFPKGFKLPDLDSMVPVIPQTK